MSNKNISQSITEAWAKSVATGMVQSEKKEQKRQQLDETSATLHNKAVQHILENDKGFYRPDTDPFFRKVDGDLLRRQRLAEETEEEKRQREAQAAKAEYQKLIDAGGGEKKTGLYQGETGITMTRDEKEKIDSELAARDKRVEAEVARISAQRETGINPESERYRGRRNEAGLRGDPDFDPTAPGSQREVRAAQVQDNLDKTERVYRGGRRLTGGYAGPGVNYGGAVAVGQAAPRELSPEERERQREEQADRSRAGAVERLKGLVAYRRKKIEKGLAPDADLDTVTTAIARERGGQDRASELRAAGYDPMEDYDTSTGGLTDLGRKKRADRQLRAGKRRAGVRARAEARENIQRTKADARAARLAARREARKKERLSASGTALAGDKPAGKVGPEIFTNTGTQSSGNRTAGGPTEINGDTPIRASGAPSFDGGFTGEREPGEDGREYVWDGQVWELKQ